MAFGGMGQKRLAELQGRHFDKSRKREFSQINASIYRERRYFVARREVWSRVWHSPWNSPKIPSTGLRGILDEAVTPTWRAIRLIITSGPCLVVNELQIRVIERVTPVCFSSWGVMWTYISNRLSITRWMFALCGQAYLYAIMHRRRRPPLTSSTNWRWW